MFVKHFNTSPLNEDSTGMLCKSLVQTVIHHPICVSDNWSHDTTVAFCGIMLWFDYN